MKKKLLGMILTLIVMMIVPLAISVGANTPAINLLVDGAVDINTGEVINRTEVGTTVGLYVSVKGGVPTTVTVQGMPAGYTVDFSRGGDDNLTFAKNGNGITITGLKVTTSPIPITVTVKDEKGQVAKTITCNVSVVERATYINGAEMDPEYKNPQYIYEVGDTFDFASILLKAYYVDTKTFAFNVYFGKSEGPAFTASQTIKQSDTGFTASYNGKDYEVKFPSDIRIVTEKDIVAVYIKDAKTEYIYNDVISAADLILEVKEKTSSGERTYYLENSEFTIDADTTNDIPGESIVVGKPEHASFTVTYDSSVKTMAVADLTTRGGKKIVISENERILKSLRAAGTPATKQYAEGQVVTDFTGLTFYATYENVKGEVQLTEEQVATIVARPCEYNVESPSKNKYITVDYTEKGVTVACDVHGFEIQQKKVEKIEVTTPPTKKDYEVGEALNLSGMMIKILYNNGTSETKAYTDGRFSCTPRNGDKVSLDTDRVTVVYDDGKVNTAATWTGFTVKANIKIKSVSITTNPTKMEYEVGEKFDPKGMKVTIVFTDETPDKTITYGESGMIVPEKKFTSKTDNTVSFTVTNPHNTNDTSYSMSLTVTVKDKVTPTTIDSISYGKTFLAGQKFDVEKDIEDYVVTMSDGTKLDKDDIDELIKDGKAKLTVSATTSHTSSTSTTTAVLKETNKSVKLFFTYNDKTVTKTLTIEVKTPVCTLTTSGGTKALMNYYEKLETALEEANDLTTTEARKVTITLNADTTLTSGYTFNAERSIILDLNAHAITMAQTQLIVPHRTAYQTVEIVLTNFASKDATIKYSSTDKDKWIILAKNDEIVIDWETEIPGLYEVTLKTDGNGKISGPTEVAHGNDAKYTITPNSGYEIASVTLDKKSQGVGSTLTIESVDSDHAIEVTFKKAEVEWVSPFKDVPKGISYYDAVGFVYENGLFKGVSDTEFEPNETMTRAMFVTVLGRLAGISEYDSRYTGKSTFKDVVSTTATSWYVPYVAWATENGLLLGYEDGTFRPDNKISHTEMYILMERYARNFLGITASTSGVAITVSDISQIPTWEGAREAVQFATRYKFLVTTNNKIKPNDDALRHELATLLQSFCASFGLLEDTAADEK